MEHENHLNEIEQYLRANNIEVVGYPDVTEGADFEKLILDIVNSLPDLNENPRSRQRAEHSEEFHTTLGT